ncbi:glycosyltransferase family 2 protein [Polynucleobacter sp. AP-Reno-20A-A9]|uniref:glycosyltransferase family 2 protein n=1 Tax=Polynucleobacter sp. AP-Reno-20A-A9 TaxID=2576925 RepID=UPI001C0B049C|nr:glycosyltransferase family 2 protein [Polynucleobacter sp. AP-Reno-20A-A9]MBU3627578.1 glycosyltransferase family 2 protein [Polynucleobacter sp. AP-Reno-20A-A9]
MAAHPLVSISMPAFNAARYIASSIQSVLDQTYQNFELIIYDDGSSDQTREIIQSFSDPRIKTILADQNQGLIVARNAIAKQAQGKYIALLDCDDVAESTRLEEQVAYLESGECDLCGTAYWTINEQSGIRKKSKQKYSNADLKALLTIGSPFCNPTVMGKVEIFKNLPYLQQNKHAEDYAFFVEAALKGWRFANLKSRLLTYRLHENQISVVQGGPAREIFKKMQLHYLKGMNIGPDYCPRPMSLMDRLRYAMPMIKRLNQHIPGISIMANYEIYARFQFRGNGVLTPFTRLERLMVSTVVSLYGRLA